MSDTHDIAQRRSRLSLAKRALLERRLRGEGDALASSRTIPHLVERATVPLSFGQERLWFLDQLEPGSAAYNVRDAYRLTGQLDKPALERAVNEVVRRHEALRTTFSVVDGRPVQVISPTLSVSLTVIALEGHSEYERQDRLLRWVNQEAERPFDLATGPLVRVTLLRVDEEDHVFILTMHHIVSDAWSRDVFFQELAVLYTAFAKGESSPLPELPRQYADFAVWQREWLHGEALKSQLAYWRRQLDAVPILDLPTDHPRPPALSYCGERQSIVLSHDLSEALKALSQKAGTTLFMTLLAAFKVLLCRYTGQTDIVVGSPIAGRTQAETEGLIGFFLNSLVLRTDLSGDPTFLELLARVREVCLEAYAHQDVPFERLLEELQLARDLSRTPLFQVFFNMLPWEQQYLDLPGLTVQRLPSVEVQSLFDLTLYVRDRAGCLELACAYRTDLFTSAPIREMMAQYECLLAQVVRNPAQSISQLTLVTPSAAKVLPDPTQPLSGEWRGAIHTRVGQHARETPARLALIDSVESWTYQELDQRSNQLANHLIASGIQPGDVVAIYAHRSASLVWALLGILKAGAAFLILDPAYPAERLLRYVSMAKPQAWIQLEAAEAPPPLLEDYITRSVSCCRFTLPCRSAVAKLGLLAGCSDADPRVAIAPDDLACVVFTSGSTGQPKGILGRHGSLTHFEPWRQDRFGLTQSDRFAMLAGLAHSPLQRDIFTPLWLGATLFIPDGEIITAPGQLAAWMAKQKITSAAMTPALGQLLDTAPPDLLLPELRSVFFVGDQLMRRDVARLRHRAPSATVINTYGTTETQRADSYLVIVQEPEGNRAKAQYPLGRGMPDVQLLVLNQGGRLAGMGELGEIYVRSPHLALGYLGDEALTRARFITNPFTGRDGDRLYRTGDLGRYLPDGNVEFSGRADHQVKIRGFRIELAEVETGLEQHPAVRKAIVLARHDAPGDSSAAPGTDSRLVAYVVPKQMPGPTVSELRSFLKERLLEHMLPSAFVFLDALPLTPNGKVDRAALPAPEQLRPELGKVLVTPRDQVECQLVRIWEEVLGVQPVGIGDDFFALGGHSLLGIRLFARIEKELGTKLPVSLLFQSPTVERLAQAIRGVEASPDWSILVPIQTGGARPPFFCVHGFGGGVLGYAELARLLGPAQPFYGLQAHGLSGRDDPDAQIEHMAARYLQAMRIVQPKGPYYVGGYCYGGVVAFEIARQLRAHGEQVALLAVLEGYALRRSEAIKQLWRPRALARFVLNLPYWLQDTLHRPDARQRLVADLRSRIWHNDERRVWDARVAQIIGVDLRDESSIPEAQRRLMAVHLQAIREYRPQVYPGALTLFRVRALSPSRSYDPEMGWGRFAMGGVEVRMTAGAHYNMLESPYVETLAATLKESLERVQEQASLQQATN